MNKDFYYYLGWLATLLVGVLLTPIYFICIAIIRLGITIIDIIWDSFTFMPKALYEYERARLKTYWQKDLDRINKKLKDN